VTVPLAGLAGVSGAEWSLFCPGKGMALDSCVGVMVLLDRAAAGSVWAAGAGGKTLSALGTELSELPPDCVPGTLGKRVRSGPWSGVGLLQASSSEVAAQAARAVNDVRMKVPQARCGP
jgi:hypothetical protein